MFYDILPSRKTFLKNNMTAKSLIFFLHTKYIFNEIDMHNNKNLFF